MDIQKSDELKIYLRRHSGIVTGQIQNAKEEVCSIATLLGDRWCDAQKDPQHWLVALRQACCEPCNARRTTLMTNDAHFKETGELPLPWDAASKVLQYRDDKSLSF